MIWVEIYLFYRFDSLRLVGRRSRCRPRLLMIHHWHSLRSLLRCYFVAAHRFAAIFQALLIATKLRFQWISFNFGHRIFFPFNRIRANFLSTIVRQTQILFCELHRGVNDVSRNVKRKYVQMSKQYEWRNVSAGHVVTFRKTTYSFTVARLKPHSLKNWFPRKPKTISIPVSILHVKFWSRTFHDRRRFLRNSLDGQRQMHQKEKNLQLK